MNKYEMIKIGIMLTQIARDLFKVLWKRQIMLTGQRHRLFAFDIRSDK